MPPRSAAPIRLSIVEDDERERATLTEVLGRSPDFLIVGSHPRPESAWNLLRTERPDMILLDLLFPANGLSGLDFLVRLRGERHPPKVVAWTVSDDEGHFLSTIQAGACGYLLKTTPLDQLPEALRAMWRGELRISAGVARLMLREFNDTHHQQTADPAHHLSPREETILQLLASGDSQGEIAAKLGISLRTVEHHLAEARRKLAARTNPQAVALYQRLRREKE
jgi:DNA-binding NarL/FixJ family response regulator